jgi:branched-chain amino acid transport system permease protein
MTFASVVIQLLNGLAAASSLFLVSAGLSLIFGVTRIVNFAHGSLYMLGLYGAYSLIEAAGPHAARLLERGDRCAALAVGLVGVLIELVDPAPHLPCARAVPAARHLRRRPGDQGRGPVRLGLGGPGRPRAPGLTMAVEILASAFRSTTCC